MDMENSILETRKYLKEILNSPKLKALEFSTMKILFIRANGRTLFFKAMEEL